MTEMLRTAFERYGSSVTVHHGETDTQTRALIQPLRKESKDEPFSVAPLGAVSERVWRYLGPREVCVEMGDHVSFNAEEYVVRSAAAVYVGDEVAYYWATLHPEEESA